MWRKIKLVDAHNELIHLIAVIFATVRLFSRDCSCFVIRLPFSPSFSEKKPPNKYSQLFCRCKALCCDLSVSQTMCEYIFVSCCHFLVRYLSQYWRLAVTQLKSEQITEIATSENAFLLILLAFVYLERPMHVLIVNKRPWAMPRCSEYNYLEF